MVGCLSFSSFSSKQIAVVSVSSFKLVSLEELLSFNIEVDLSMKELLKLTGVVGV